MKNCIFHSIHVIKMNRWHISSFIITLKTIISETSYLLLTTQLVRNCWQTRSVSKSQSATCNYLHTCSPNYHQPLKWCRLMAVSSVSRLNQFRLSWNQHKQHGLTHFFLHCTNKAKGKCVKSLEVKYLSTWHQLLKVSFEPYNAISWF